MAVSLDLDVLVPEAYAAWRPLVRDAFAFFVANLSPERRVLLAAEQASLPADSDIATRLVHLMHECPTLHKLGQVLARHRELDERFRERLQQLESFEPRTPWSAVEPIVAEELGPFLSTYSIVVERKPLAEASVAVVVPITFQLPGSGTAVQRGVLKILKPGVAGKLNEELAILGLLADYLDNRRTAYHLPLIDYRDTFETVRDLLQHEIRFDVERANLEAAGQRFARDDRVVIPGSLPFCTPRILAMTRIEGTKLTEAAGSNMASLARILLEAVVLRPILDLESDAPFHADPHAGNLFATSDHRLAILDWSLTGVLSKVEREHIARALLAAAVLDETGVRERIVSLCIGEPPVERIGEIVRRAIREAPLLPGPTWFMRVLDEAARNGARFAGDLLLFRKTLLTVQGVAADLCEGVSLDEVLMSGILSMLVREWPLRAWAPFESRGLATHLSSFDLTRAAWSAPLAAARRWTSFWGLSRS